MPIDLVPQLLNAAVRACVLGSIAWAGLWLFRVRSAAARHAVWTAVVVGMLFQFALGPVVPGVRLSVLPAAPAPVRPAMAIAPRTSAPSRALPSAPRGRIPSTCPTAPVGLLTGLYLSVSILLFARTAFGWWRLRRIVRRAKPLPELGRGFLESAALVVPAAVGCFAPRILLPPGWRNWDNRKRNAVIAHETAHLARRDWLVALVSRVNVCVFWFHPLAWRMDRELSRLAEEACDDAALSEGEDRDQYAATLVEFARAVAAQGSRLSWGVISMAKESNVSRRVNRILDGCLPRARQFGRLAWVLLLTGGLPLIYFSAAVQLAPAQGNAGRALSLCLVVDNSGSMFGKEKQVKAAALALVRAGQPGDEFCVVDFNDESFLDADVSTDFSKAAEAVGRFEARGGSALRDAIQLSVDVLQQKAHNRKVLVLIADGHDNASAATDEQLRDKIRNSGVLVSSIALADGPGWRTLTGLAALSGGVLYHPLAPAEVENAASTIVRAARSK